MRAELALLCLAFLGTPAVAGSLDMKGAQALALRENAEVRAAQAEVEAAKARLEGAGELPLGNPELSLAAGSRWRPALRTDELNLELSVPIEVAGQRGWRMSAATAALEAAKARLATREGVVASEVRQAFGSALAAAGEARLADEASGVAKEALFAAGERHRAGETSLIEVNLARIELGRANRDRSAAAHQVRAAYAGLKALLAMPPETALELQGTLEELQRTAAPPDGLVERANARRPELAAARAELEAALSEQRLATREVFPTPRLGAIYAQEEGAQIVQGTLSFDLPLFRRNQAARGEGSAKVLQARLALEEQERKVRQEVQLALSRRQAAQEAAETFSEEVVKAATSNLELATQGYRAGQLDFQQLLFIRGEALETRRGQLEALQELNAANAELLRAVGAGPDGR
ncbi:MAG: TolC family protein [Myxococcaceae bacterium]